MNISAESLARGSRGLDSARARRALFLTLLLLFSSVPLSISQTPHVNFYKRSTSVPLVTSRYAPPINDRNRKERRGWGAGRFLTCFFSQKSRSKNKIYPYSTLPVYFKFEFLKCFIFSFPPPFNDLRAVQYILMFWQSIICTFLNMYSILKYKF